MSFRLFNQSPKNEFYKKYMQDIDGNNFMTLVNSTSDLNREIYITSITPEVANKVDKIIRFWNDVDDSSSISFGEREPIKIYIDSFGGSLSAALTIVDAIKLSKTQVYTINIGNVQKESFYIYLAGLKRYSYPRATFLFERDLKPFEASDATQSNYADFCEKQATELKDFFIERTKITDNEYEKRKLWWLTPERAYELHICNEVLRGKNI